MTQKRLNRISVHLSLNLQKQLHNLNTSVRLASTIDGILPDKYAFYNKPGRSFRAEFASNEDEISVVLFEKNVEHNYEYCFARGLFKNIERLAKAIDLWIDKQKSILELKKQFDELELYKEFESKNDNPHIDEAWTKVKNIFFNDTKFWEYSEWKDRYDEMLTEAKYHQAFINYFPFTSHYWLRFSINKDLTETWPLDIYLIPTMYSQEVPETLGKFYVSYNDKPMGGRFFETAKDALDFYAEWLKMNNPIKWLSK